MFSHTDIVIHVNEDTELVVSYTACFYLAENLIS